MTGRGRRVLAIAAAIAALAGTLSLASSAPASATAATFQYREQSQGAILIASPDCPFGDWVPHVDTLCDTYTVWYVRVSQTVDGGPVDTHTPFHAELDHEVDLVHPDGTGYAVSFEYGIADVTGTYDAQHLSSASMHASALEMRSVDLATGAESDTGRLEQLGPFAWMASSDVYEWGNDGPAFADRPRHLSTRCFTANRLAHQKDTAAYVSGTIDAESVDDMYQDVQIPGLEPVGGAGNIFNNWFHVNRAVRCFE